MAKKILAVDDELELLSLLEMSLTDAGYVVRTAANAAEAMAGIRKEKPDLIVLDIMLPDVSGMKLTGQLKNTAATADIPIILLTAKDTERDMLVGFELGADDYITKPFSMAVLIARIEAVLRRAVELAQGSEEVLTAGPIRIMPASRRVFAGQRSVELTPAEFTILEALIRARPAVLSRQQLMAQIGSEQAESAERVINVHVSAIRRKLGSAKKVIKTVHAAGYRIES